MTSYLVVVLVKRDLLEKHGVSFKQQVSNASCVTCPSKEDSVACCPSCMLSVFVCHSQNRDVSRKQGLPGHVSIWEQFRPLPPTPPPSTPAMFDTHIDIPRQRLVRVSGGLAVLLQSETERGPERRVQNQQTSELTFERSHTNTTTKTVTYSNSHLACE